MECRRSNLDFGHSVDQRGKMDTNHELSHEYPQTYQLWEQYQLRNIQEMGVSYQLGTYQQYQLWEYHTRNQ